MDRPSDPDGRASGVRAVMLCIAVGLLCLSSVAGSQAFGWGQVPFEKTWDDPLLLSTTSYWSNFAGIFLATFGLVALSARRVNWGLFVLGATFTALAFGPPSSLTIGLLVVAGLAAVQIGFFLGDIPRLVRLPAGAAQAISNGVFVTGIPLATAGFAWLAAELGPGAFGVLAVVMFGAGCMGAVIFRTATAPPPPAEPYRLAVVMRAKESWTRRSLLGFVISGLSAGAVGAHLLPLPSTLSRAGFREPRWLLLAAGTLVPAGIAVTILWAILSRRWRDRGLRPAAAGQLAGCAIMGLASLYQGGWFLAAEILGLLVLNAAREAFSASLFATVGDTAQRGAVVVAGLVAGYAAAGTASAVAVANIGGVGGPAIVAAVFAGACLGLTVIKTPAEDGGYIQPAQGS